MIDTVLFDMGGTLEDIFNTPETLAGAADKIDQILRKHGMGTGKHPDELAVILDEGLKLYSAARDVNYMEQKPERIWTDYMLRGLGLDIRKLEGISEELAFAWENSYFNRSLRPGSREMLRGLRSLGFKLGIVSNTASLFQVFDQLEKYGIREYFCDVTLSSQVGYRKPHPNIFRISLLQMRSRPENSVYVGDTVSRDIIGSKAAGFAYSILISSQLTREKDDALQNAPRPDYTVKDIFDVLQVCEALIGQCV